MRTKTTTYNNKQTTTKNVQLVLFLAICKCTQNITRLYLKAWLKSSKHRIIIVGNGLTLSRLFAARLQIGLQWSDYGQPNHIWIYKHLCVFIHLIYFFFFFFSFIFFFFHFIYFIFYRSHYAKTALHIYERKLNVHSKKKYALRRKIWKLKTVKGWQVFFQLIWTFASFSLQI